MGKEEDTTTVTLPLWLALDVLCELQSDTYMLLRDAIIKAVAKSDHQQKGEKDGE